jgi:hypothetical protein
MLGLIVGVFGCVFIALGSSTPDGDGDPMGIVQIFMRGVAIRAPPP